MGSKYKMRFFLTNWKLCWTFLAVQQRFYSFKCSGYDLFHGTVSSMTELLTRYLHFSWRLKETEGERKGWHKTSREGGEEHKTSKSFFVSFDTSSIWNDLPLLLFLKWFNFVTMWALFTGML